MIKNLKFFVAVVALALLAATVASTSASSSDASTPASQEGAGVRSGGLTPQEKRGKVIYTRGESPTGGEITAVVAEVEVPPSTLTCAGCHGLRGEGKTEGGVTAGALAWAHLLKPHTHPSGRRHVAFDQASFVKSVVHGVDPDGNELAVAMPRFRMSPEDMADLIAYLTRIGSEIEPGLGETAIRVGTVLPSQGALSESGAAMRDVLAAYFEDVNGRGGIHNRRVELRVADAGDDASAVVAGARRLVEREEVFALVGGISAGADRELAALAHESGTPFIGPSTLLPQTSAPLNRHVFYLLPGLGEQARALVNFAAAKPGRLEGRVLVVHPEGELAGAAAVAAEDQARKAGSKSVVKELYARAGFDARQLVQKLKGENTDALFFFGGGGEESAVIKEAAAVGWTPHVFLLGALAGRDLAANVPPGFRDRVFVAFPSVPSDLTAAGVAEFRALQEKYRIAPRHAAAQLAAFAAARIFVEGLRRAGQDLTREKLIDALEGLYDYDTGVTPRITFGPNRRVGAAGASVLTIDTEKKEFAAVGGWVKAF